MYESTKILEKPLEDIPCVVVMRVSSSRQADVQHGSLEQQKHSINLKIAETSRRTGKNYYVVEFIEEDVSAKVSNTKNRKDLMRVEYLIKSGKAKALFVDRCDRFSRDLGYNINFSRMMVDCKAEYHEVENGRVDFNQQDQYFNYVLRSFNAEAYSVNLSKTVRSKGRSARVNNGKDHQTIAVYGIDAHPTYACKYVINPKEAELLNELGWYLVRTRDFKASARYGNQLGIRTKERWTKERIDKNGERKPSEKIGGELLNPKRVRTLLYSPKVRGVGNFQDDLDQFPELRDQNGIVQFQYSHGSVLSNELIIELDKLSKDYSRNTSHRSDEYLLSGFLYCSDGKKYTGNSSYKSIGKGGKKKYTYYIVKTEFESIKRIKTEILDNGVIERLKGYLQGSDVFKKLLLLRDQKYKNKIVALEDEIERSKVSLNHKKDVFEKFTEKVRDLVLSDISDMQEMLGVIQEEKSKILTECKELEVKLLELNAKVREFCHKVSDEKFLKDIQKFFGNFDQLSNCDKKILLRAFIPVIIIHPDLQIELRLNEKFSEEIESDSFESEKFWRANLKWLGRWGSNPRPID